jgi:hypothetical protein
MGPAWGGPFFSLQPYGDKKEREGKRKREKNREVCGRGIRRKNE